VSELPAAASGGLVAERGSNGWPTWPSAAEPLTIGVEEEFMLLDPRDWTLASCTDTVIAELPAELQDRVTRETHAGVLEVATRPHRRVADAVAELADLRVRLADTLARLGLRAAAAGTHPSAAWHDTAVSSHERYREIGESMRVLARREPTLATHVHIGVPAPEDAVRLLNGLRAHLPLLLALSANSPFWQGRVTGFASTRTTLFDAFPRSGVPRRFSGYTDWAATVARLVRSRAIADPTFLWWDVRLQPRFGTVEVRSMDAQTRVDDVAALAALVQSLARLELEGPDHDVPAELIEENRFLASRDGMQASLIDVHTGERVAAVRLLERILDACRPHARALGCEQELGTVRRLAARTGASRQLAYGRHGDLERVTSRLAYAYLPAVACG
jgi:glutamate---cysteine ligase / carboxylate-amine ligase